MFYGAWNVVDYTKGQNAFTKNIRTKKAWIRNPEILALRMLLRRGRSIDLRLMRSELIRSDCHGTDSKSIRGGSGRGEAGQVSRGLKK